MTQSTALPRIDVQAYFLAASAEYERCLGQLEGQQVVASELKAALAVAREELKDIEADVLANGGHGKYVIDAGAADRRAALLRSALTDHPGYVSKRAEVARRERELAKAEAQRDHTANVMALARRRMDANIAATQRAASLLMYGPNHGYAPSERH